MLSPGKHHLLIPKDPIKNLEMRIGILEAAEHNSELQRGLIQMCREDFIFFVDLFVWQINPDIMEKGPFVLWPYQEVAVVGGMTKIGGREVFQEGILACVLDRKDVRWPKSRDGGASWVVLMTILWLCLFHDNITAGALSRDEDSVDKIGDPNSLFEKVRVMLRYLPGWMKGDVEKRSKKGSFIFDNGNTFIGEANVASAMVGGRLTILLIDEFGQFDKNGEWIYDFTRDVCKCRVFVFTHKDQQGMAYRLCYDAKFKHMREIMTHWSQHPKKNKGLYKYDKDNNNIIYLDPGYEYPPDFEFVYESKPVGGPCPGIRSPWYDEECPTRNDRDVSMNLDIDPRGASDQFFDPYRINVLIAEHCRPPCWIGNLIYDKEDGQPKELVADPEGLVKLWVNPKSPAKMPRIRGGAGVDISAGVGKSPSCLSLMNAGTGEKVLEYSNANIFQPDLAIFVAALLRLFEDENGTHPLLTWEIQYAMVFDQMIRKIGYRPYFIRRDEDVMGRPRDNKGRAGESTAPKAIYGRMVDYRQGLYEGNCINRSVEAMEETLSFVYTSTAGGVAYRSRGTKVNEQGSGATIHHGDMVVADALAYKMAKQLGFEGPQKTEEKKHPRPGSWDFREWLHDKQGAEEEDEVWV